MGKCTYGGFQTSAANAPQPTGIIFGANLRKPPPEKSKPKKEPTQVHPSRIQTVPGLRRGSEEEHARLRGALGDDFQVSPGRKRRK